jgi:hypothetical protein
MSKILKAIQYLSIVAVFFVLIYIFMYFSMIKI